jgi:AraC-like DNA-binding protein
MLLEYGNTTAAPDWKLNEEAAVGYARVYYVHEAEVLYEDGRVRTSFKPDTLYVLPTSHPYRAWKVSMQSFRCMYMHIDLFPLSVAELIERPVFPDTSMYHYLETIRRLIAEKNVRMIYELADCFAGLLHGDPHLARPSVRIEKALAYINEHIGETMTLEVLGAVSSYHPNYFLALFKRENGVTPYQYILRLRMQKARSLLREGMRIGEVACAVGFSDASSFARAFGVLYGLTPRQYARRGNVVP